MGPSPAPPALRPGRLLVLAVATALLLGVGCGGDPAGPGGGGVASLEVEPADALLVGVGDTLTFRARARDGGGALLPGAPVAWSVDDPSVASLDAGGRAVAAAPGETVVRARAGGSEATARLEVWVPSEPEAWEAGTSYWGRARYVEYVPGTLPLVVSAPHGGALEPAEIPDRTSGVTAPDRRTRETAAALVSALRARTGHAPHLIVSHLRRSKLDPNREIEEAAQGDPHAEQGWREFHAFIETARETVARDFGRGLYLDLHGHGHPVPRVELGYLLSAEALGRSDQELDAGGYAAESSVRALHAASPLPFSALLRGPTALGSLMEARGVAAVPSDVQPSPGGEPYFTGGYATRRHGSREPGEVVDGIQLELHWSGLRETPEGRAAFAEAMAGVLEAFMEEHYGVLVPPPAALTAPPLPPVGSAAPDPRRSPPR